MVVLAPRSFLLLGWVSHTKKCGCYSLGKNGKDMSPLDSNGINIKVWKWVFTNSVSNWVRNVKWLLVLKLKEYCLIWQVLLSKKQQEKHCLSIFISQHKKCKELSKKFLEGIFLLLNKTKPFTVPFEYIFTKLVKYVNHIFCFV